MWSTSDENNLFVLIELGPSPFLIPWPLLLNSRKIWTQFDRSKRPQDPRSPKVAGDVETVRLPKPSTAHEPYRQFSMMMNVIWTSSG